MRKSGNWPLGHGFYIGLGFYFQKLKRYLHYFNDNQIKIFLYDDYCQNTYATLNKIYRFLEIPENIFPKTLIRHNTSGMPKNKIIHYLLQPRTFTHQIRRHMPGYIHDPVFVFFMKLKSRNLIKPPMDSSIRLLLIEIFYEDILQLQQLINKDLSHWLK